MKASCETRNHELIDLTRAVWEPRLDRDLSRDEANQIAGDVTGFFSVLAEWSRKERQQAVNGVTSDIEEVRDER